MPAKLDKRTADLVQSAAAYDKSDKAELYVALDLVWSGTLSTNWTI